MFSRDKTKNSGHIRAAGSVSRQTHAKNADKRSSESSSNLSVRFVLRCCIEDPR